jgi:hypothetical protein
MATLRRTFFISAAACAIVASTAGSALAQPTTTGPTVTIGVSSANAKAYGYTFVVFGNTYDHQKYATATISGSVSNATSGNVAQLYAQPFPYKHAPVAVADQQLVLNGASSEHYSFSAIPGIATRYSVEILPSATVSAPAQAASAAVTSYVVTDQWSTGVKTCNRAGNRPICHQSIRIRTLLPASAYRAEARKKLYFYFAINLNSRRIPTTPVWLTLDNSARIGKAKRVSAVEFEQTVVISFRVNNDAYNFNFSYCSKASESSDGVNLPGHHHCGAKRVKDTWFLG